MKKLIGLTAAIVCAAVAYGAQGYVHDTGQVAWTNDGAAVVSGQIVDLGDRYGIALSDQASNAVGTVATLGVWSLQRADTNAVADGASLFYSTATSVTATATADRYIGQAVGAVPEVGDLTNSLGKVDQYIDVDLNAPQRQVIVGTDVQAYAAILTTIAALPKATTNQAFINGAGTTSTLYISSGIITNVAQ